MRFQRYLLLLTIAVVFAMGLVMVFNTTSADILDRDLDQDTHHAMLRHILYAICGCVAGLIAWAIGYRNLLRASPFLLGLCVIMLIMVLIPGVGKTVNGARRWIALGPYSMQPSECVKFVIPLFYIHIYLKTMDTPWDLRQFAKVMGMVLAPAALVFLEPDTGTTFIIGASILVLLLLTRIKWKFWVLPTLVLTVLAAGLAWQLPYARGRIAVYLNPEMDILGRGHQPYQAKIAAGSGGLIGRGIGKSLQKLNYLPEAQNDYIGAIYAEEFGFSGILLLISLYMLITYLGFHIAFQSKDKGAFYLAAIITFLISFQAFLNLGVVSGLLPSKGINLPFFSQGGTSLMANLAAIGVLLNISMVAEKGTQKVYTKD